MKLTTCKKVCNECPFSSESQQGWLGNHTVDEILNGIQMEGLFSCHKQRGDSEHENLHKIVTGEQNICRGFILSATKSCKLFGQNKHNGKELRRLQDEVGRDKDELDGILTKWNFSEHHTI